MDSLKNLSSTQNALANFKQAVAKINSKLEELTQNKAEVSKAWQSANGESFTSQYQTLIESLTKACQNFGEYQKKIEAVVNEFNAFDTTITTGEQ